MVGIILVGFYALFALIAGLNWLLMRRALPCSEADPLIESPTILIPARNEEANLDRLLPALFASVAPGQKSPHIFVFDDESEDGTSEVATRHGATVISPSESLPEGWTGKNRACHRLAETALREINPEWILFLDADVYPGPEFLSAVSALTQQVRPTTSMVSGFPRIIPGIGIEPLFLGWVGWILLATNPYGLVTLTGKGNNRFTNGQFGLWRMSTYAQLWPNEAVRSHILEDVKIGRLCASEGIGVEIVNLSAVMAVKMYHTWRETLDGMSKNSHEITGTVTGSVLLSLLFLVIGWGWTMAGQYWELAVGLLLLSGLFCSLIVRARPYGVWMLPLTLTIGAFTILRSMVWHRRGTVMWKGRTYGP